MFPTHTHEDTAKMPSIVLIFPALFSASSLQEKSTGNRPSAYLDETRAGLPVQPSTDRRGEDTDARPWKVGAARAGPEMPTQEDGLHEESLAGGRVVQRRGQS